MQSQATTPLSREEVRQKTAATLTRHFTAMRSLVVYWFGSGDDRELVELWLTNRAKLRASALTALQFLQAIEAELNTLGQTDNFEDVMDDFIAGKDSSLTQYLFTNKPVRNCICKEIHERICALNTANKAFDLFAQRTKKVTNQMGTYANLFCTPILMDEEKADLDAWLTTGDGTIFRDWIVDFSAKMLFVLKMQASAAADYAFALYALDNDNLQRMRVFFTENPLVLRVIEKELEINKVYFKEITKAFGLMEKFRDLSTKPETTLRYEEATQMMFQMPDSPRMKAMSVSLEEKKDIEDGVRISQKQ